jgi:hypothetical protein
MGEDASQLPFAIPHRIGSIGWVADLRRLLPLVSRRPRRNPCKRWTSRLCRRHQTCDPRSGRGRARQAARAFAKKGKVPPGVDEPGIYCAVRAPGGNRKTRLDHGLVSREEAAAEISSPTPRSPGATLTICRCAPPPARSAKPPNRRSRGSDTALPTGTESRAPGY